MRKSLTLAATIALAIPAGAVAQTGFGAGVKAGSIGIGAEAAVGFGQMIAIRGGAAIFPVDFDGTFSDIDFEVDLPDTYVNIGVDVYPTGGSFRLSGGLLIKPDNPKLRGTFTEPQEIGGRTYTPQQIGTLVGEIDSGSTAPFAMLGFGRHTSTGLGFYADLGAAFLKEPTLSLRQEGGTLSGAERAEFEQRLEQERQDIEDDLGGYLRVYPILQLGLRIGRGR
jgi:hypothetical protein